MITFDVTDMTCGHCASAITQALKAADPSAAVHIDLATHRVQVQGSAAGADALGRAIAEAGYTPVAVDAAACGGGAAARAGCCGGCH